MKELVLGVDWNGGGMRGEGMNLEGYTDEFDHLMPVATFSGISKEEENCFLWANFKMICSRLLQNPFAIGLEKGADNYVIDLREEDKLNPEGHLLQL